MKRAIPKFLTYFLCIFALNQAHYANEGQKWMKSSLDATRQAAEEGDAYAQGFLALLYAHGDKGLDISYSEARRWSALSSQSSHWLGYFVHGYLSRNPSDDAFVGDLGRYYLKSFQDPDGRLIKAAAAGDPIASYVLAEIFTTEEIRPTLEPDLAFAAKHYIVASNAGYGPACVELSLLKIQLVDNEDFEVEKDLANGVSLLKEISRSNLPSAHHYLATAYFKGIGIESDLKMAEVHFQAAADRGYANSQLAVSRFYAYGLTGSPKIDLALRYARLALGQQETLARKYIAEFEGLLNQRGIAGGDQPLQPPSPVVPSPTASIPPAPPPSPSLGHRVPSPGLGLDPALPPTYGNQVITPALPAVSPPSVPPESVNSYMPSTPLVPDPPPLPSLVAPVIAGTAEQNRVVAKKHYFGREASLDYSLALRYFTQSANAGDAESARYLGIMYLRGKGVPKDNRKALEWFTLASERGDNLAQKNAKIVASILGE